MFFSSVDVVFVICIWWSALWLVAVILYYCVQCLELKPSKCSNKMYHLIVHLPNSGVRAKYVTIFPLKQRKIPTKFVSMNSTKANQITQAHPRNGSLMKSFDHTCTHTHSTGCMRIYLRESLVFRTVFFSFLCTLTPSSLRLPFRRISIVHHSRQNTAAVKVYAYVRHRHLDTYTFLWIIRWKMPSPSPCGVGIINDSASF